MHFVCNATIAGAKAGSNLMPQSIVITDKKIIKRLNKKGHGEASFWRIAWVPNTPLTTFWWNDYRFDRLTGYFYWITKEKPAGHDV